MESTIREKILARKGRLEENLAIITKRLNVLEGQAEALKKQVAEIENSAKGLTGLPQALLAQAAESLNEQAAALMAQAKAEQTAAERETQPELDKIEQAELLLPQLEGLEAAGQKEAAGLIGQAIEALLDPRQPVPEKDWAAAEAEKAAEIQAEKDQAWKAKRARKEALQPFEERVLEAERQVRAIKSKKAFAQGKDEETKAKAAELLSSAQQGLASAKERLAKAAEAFDKADGSFEVLVTELRNRSKDNQAKRDRLVRAEAQKRAEAEVAELQAEFEEAKKALEQAEKLVADGPGLIETAKEAHKVLKTVEDEAKAKTQAALEAFTKAGAELKKAQAAVPDEVKVAELKLEAAKADALCHQAKRASDQAEAQRAEAGKAYEQLLHKELPAAKRQVESLKKDISRLQKQLSRAQQAAGPAQA